MRGVSNTAGKQRQKLVVWQLLLHVVVYTTLTGIRIGV